MMLSHSCDKERVDASRVHCLPCIIERFETEAY